MEPKIKKGDIVWDKRQKHYNIIVSHFCGFGNKRLVVGQDLRTIPLIHASLEQPLKRRKDD